MSGTSDGRLSLFLTGRGLIPIGPRTRLIFRGADAARYLNGQVTIDVSRLAIGTGRAAGVLTAKGKLCALIFVIKTQDGFVVEAPFELRESVQARLERYIIADDVTIEDASLENAGFHHIAGEGNGLAIPRFRTPGIDTDTPAVGLPVATAEEMECLRIRAGVPLWGRDMNENTLPQEIRMEDFAIDFDKGCYVGQEVVSRLKSVGRVNRRLHGFAGTFDTASPGPLLLRAEDSGDAAGSLTSWSHDLELSRGIALGYLHKAFDEGGRFTVTDEAGSTLGIVERRAFSIS